MSDFFCDSCLRIGARDNALFSKSVPEPGSVENEWLKGSVAGYHDTGPFVLSLNRTWSEMIRSGQAGCSFCHFLAQQGEDGFRRSRPARGGDSSKDWLNQLFLVRLSERMGDDDRIFFGGSGRKMADEERLKDGDHLVLFQGVRQGPRFSLCVDGTSNETDPSITRRTIPRSAVDAAALRFLASRLDHCRKHHAICSDTNAKDASFRPTRLIDLRPPRPASTQALGPPKRVKLVQTQNLPLEMTGVAYVALSHCWGPTPSSITRALRSNIGSFQDEGIEVTTLPQNFKDAINLARYLNIPFLWIDSLCIVQDDEEGWVREAHLMSSVYENAILTISASRAKSAAEGFLLRQRDHRFTQPSIRIPGSEYSLQLMNRGPRGTDDPLKNAIAAHDQQPIGRRAWVLQERILSRRTVFFDSSQVMWECRTARYLEGWIPSIEEMGISLPVLGHPSSSTAVHSLQIRGPARTGVEFTRYCYSWWDKVLTEYIIRDMTVKTDVLPALSGLARMLSTLTDSTYCVGLWRDDLIHGLAWHFDSTCITTGETPVLSAAQDMPQSIADCFAPSWSWASAVHGLHRRTFQPSPASPPNYMGRKNVLYMGNYREPALAYIIDVQLAPRSAGNVFGHMRSAKLVVEGPCGEIVIKRRLLAPGWVYFAYKFFAFGDMHQSHHLPYFIDHPHWLYRHLEEIDPRNETGVKVIELVLSGSRRLLLVEAGTSPVDGHLLYKRIGLSTRTHSEEEKVVRRMLVVV